MAKTTIGGDDPKHSFSDELKDKEEKRLRDLGKLHF